VPQVAFRPPPGLGLEQAQPSPFASGSGGGSGGDSSSASASAGGALAIEWPAIATTVMLRNIPNRYTPEECLHDIIEGGFDRAFDFFYLPTDFATKKNKGYAFVNLIMPAVAARFRQTFDGQRLTRYVTKKVLEVTPAVTQGFQANAFKYLKHQSARVQNPWFKPMIFLTGDDGVVQQLALPLAEENLPAPMQQMLQASKGKRETVPNPEEATTTPSSAAENDADAAAAMQAAVRKFLATCGASASAATSASVTTTTKTTEGGAPGVDGSHPRPRTRGGRRVGRAR